MASSLATIAFPIISRPVPSFSSPDEFLDRVSRDTPHWIYHLRIRASGRKTFESRFLPIKEEYLRRLAARLHLKQGFQVNPREFVHGAEELPPGRRSEYVFGFPAYFAAHSARLALAVGLVAAATQRSLPPQVLLSGGLPDDIPDDLRVEFTKQVEAKVLLSFGLDADYNLRPVLDRWFEEPNTAKWLGPRELRTEPGKVRLLVLADDTDTDPRAFAAPLSVREITDVNLYSFGQEDFADLLWRIDELAGDDLLLVQVPTAWHALRLLGYHHTHPAIVEKHADILKQPIRVYRIRHSQASLGVPLKLDEQDEVRQELARLQYALSTAQAQDVYTRLNIILDQARRLLRCQSGDILARGRDPGLLRVMARYCPDLDELPHFVPCVRGRETHVLSDTRTCVVKSVDDEEDSEHAAAVAACDPQASHFTAEQCEQYRKFLRSIKAYVKVPLCPQPEVGPREVVGAMYLRRDTPGEFSPRTVRLVEALGQRAAEEVAAFLREERLAVRKAAPLWGAGSVEELARRGASVSPAGLQQQLANELARVARERTGAYRAAVRLLSEDREQLITVGFSSAHPDAREAVQAPCLSWSEDSSARYAVRTGRSYIIPDLASTTDVLHMKDIPPPPHCHAAILLRVGGHILGVLNVDWDRPGACDPAVQGLLEELAGRYALALKAYSIDELFTRVDRLCASALQNASEPNLPPFVWTVAQMVGAAEAALFLRRHETGHYHLAYSLQRPKWNGDYSYALGEGVTGWVAQQNRAVRIADLRDQAELDALGPPSPVWLHKGFDGQEMEGLGFGFLGVPLAVGDDVLGVFHAVSPKVGGFSTYDQQLALSAASRMAGCLYQRGEQQWDRDFLHRSYRLTASYLGDILQQPFRTSGENETQLLREIGGGLRERLGATMGWLWITQKDDERLHCRAAWGVPEDNQPTLELEAVPQALLDAPFLLVRDPERDQRLAMFVAGLDSASRRALADLQGVLIRIRSSGRILALLFAGVPQDRHISQSWLENMIQLLEPVIEMIAHGHQMAARLSNEPAREQRKPQR